MLNPHNRFRNYHDTSSLNRIENVVGNILTPEPYHNSLWPPYYYLNYLEIWSLGNRGTFSRNAERNRCCLRSCCFVGWPRHLAMNGWRLKDFLSHFHIFFLLSGTSRGTITFRRYILLDFICWNSGCSNCSHLTRYPIYWLHDTVNLACVFGCQLTPEEISRTSPGYTIFLLSSLRGWLGSWCCLIVIRSSCIGCNSGYTRYLLQIDRYRIFCSYWRS